MTRRLARVPGAILAIGAALALSGCAKKSAAPLAPPAATSAVVLEEYPPARSTSVRYDTGIWVRFSEPLDLSTVNADNIYFKLDTARYPVTFEWDAAENRLRIVPAGDLLLRRTYTVEITRRVKTAAGGIVGDPFSWQFTTNSLRSIVSSIPPDGATWESPFTMLGWDSTESDAGSIRYSVWIGTDSGAIANRTALALATPDRGFWIPRTRWAQGRRMFWTVRATNLETGEMADSPLWRFDVIPAGSPVDTVGIPVADWGSWNDEVRRLYCRGTVYAGDFNNNAFYWNLAPYGPGLRLEGQEVTIPLLFEPQNVGTYQLTVSPTRAGFNPCDINRSIPEAEPLEVGFGVRQGTTLGFRFSSDYFAAHVEAMARYGRVWGYTARASQYSFLALGGARGVLYLHRYRPPAAAARVASPGPEVSRSRRAAGSRLPFTEPRASSPIFTRP